MRKPAFLFAALLAFAAAADPTVQWSRVLRTTPVNTNLVGASVGDGLSLEGGVLSSSGGGGLTTNDVRAIVEESAGPTNRIVRMDESGTIRGPSDLHVDGTLDAGSDVVAAGDMEALGDFYSWRGERKYAISDLAIASVSRTNLPPVSASATVGELVDSINAVINAMRKEDE